VLWRDDQVGAGRGPHPLQMSLELAAGIGRVPGSQGRFVIVGRQVDAVPLGLGLARIENEDRGAVLCDKDVAAGTACPRVASLAAVQGVVSIAPSSRSLPVPPNSRSARLPVRWMSSPQIVSLPALP